MNTETTAIEQLLANRAQKVAELTNIERDYADAQAVRGRLEAEAVERWNDEKALKKLSDCAIKLSLFPKKIDALRGELNAAGPTVIAAIRECAKSLDQDLRDYQKRLTQEVFGVIRPYCDSDPRAMALVNQCGKVVQARVLLDGTVAFFNPPNPADGGTPENFGQRFLRFYNTVKAEIEAQPAPLAEQAKG